MQNGENDARNAHGMSISEKTSRLSKRQIDEQVENVLESGREILK